MGISAKGLVSLRGARGRQFPDTQWSLIQRAAYADGESRRTALATLISRYQPALLSYLWHKRRIQGDDAGELLQAFIADQVLEYGLLGHVREGKGRFRNFLLTSLDRFSISRYRRATVRKTESCEMLQHTASNAHPTPDAIALAAWARSLIHAVLAEMKAECDRLGRMDIWAVFEKRMLAEFFQGHQAMGYERLAADLQLDSPMQAANLLVTAKRMYARLLRNAVAEYELGDSNIELEIAELRSALEGDSREVDFGNIPD